jgi:hypothetical protein
VLKTLLGHSPLDICLRYLAPAQSDADANHKVASPVMNWRHPIRNGSCPIAVRTALPVGQAAGLCR